MTAPGGPPRPGRHSSGDAAPGAGQPSGWAGASVGDGFPPGSGRGPADLDATGPMLDAGRRARASADRPGAGDDGPEGHGFDRQHPSAPLPPMPTGAWGRLRPRDDGDDDATVAAPYLSAHPDDDSAEDAPEHGGSSWDDETGGLEVIGAHVDEERPRRRGLLRSRRAVAPAPAAAGGSRNGPHGAESGDPGRLLGSSDDLDGHGLADDEIPVEPYDSSGDRRRRRRRPLAVILALLVLGAIMVGIVVGGQRLLGLLDPTARDYDGAGTGSVDVRVQEGDTLSDIARTLEEADVIASTAPFVAAAKEDPDATGIQPGVYSLRLQMSGAEALELLLDPSSRQISRVTVPEGFTVEQVLARLAEETGTPLPELEAAADPAQLTLPAYAGGRLEGYLFPATYDFEPGTTPQQMLQRMIDTFTDVAGRLRLEERAASLGRAPGEIVTVASMVQSETRLDEERPDVAQVIYNRLERGIPLGIDATLAYGLDKSGNELTVTDLQNDSPYNTRTRQGLPPTPISSPGEASLEAALAPTTGDLLYYVLETAEGRHFFTSDYAEFQAARQRCAEAGLGCGG